MLPFAQVLLQKVRNRPSLDDAMKFCSVKNDSISDMLKNSDQAVVDFDPADKCCVYATTMKTTMF